MLRYGFVLLAAVTAYAQTAVQTGYADREKLSDMASRMLQSAEQARAAIAKKDTGMASHYVSEALENITAMEIARPRAPQPFLVTLYTEMVQISVAQPANPAPANTGSANRSATGEVVHNTEGEATRVTLNATQAKQHLQTARDALNKGDLTAADNALAAVAKDVSAETVAGDLPLLKARQNLAMALGEVRQQRYDEAVAPLREASAALGQYASASKSAHSKDAGKLKSEIDTAANSFEQNHSDAEKKINKWWNEVSDWFTPLQPPAK